MSIFGFHREAFLHPRPFRHTYSTVLTSPTHFPTLSHFLVSPLRPLFLFVHPSGPLSPLLLLLSLHAGS